MDADRFDQIARALIAAPSRRAVLSAALAAAAGRLGAGGAGAACLAPGKRCDPKKPGACCSKKCPAKTKRCACTPATCRSTNRCKPAACVNGRCVKKNRPDGAPCGACRVCAGGVCVAAPEGTACPDDGNPCTDDICRAGTCVHPRKDDHTPCGRGIDFCDGRPCGEACSGGVCAEIPACDGINKPCSGECCAGGDPQCGGQSVCECSGIGLPCFVTGDCCSGGVCVGFVCR